MFNICIVCVTDNSLIKFDDQTAYAAVKNLLWTNVSGYYTAIVSHPNIIYDGGANLVTIQTTNGLFFNLDYLEVAAAWYDNLLLHVVGYKSNVVIANNTFTLQVFTVPRIYRIRQVDFKTSGGTKHPAVSSIGTHFAMDNVCLSFIWI
jgi:hypothetical protein